MARPRRPARPNYTARRIVVAGAAVALLVIVVGAVAWAVGGPMVALLHPSTSSSGQGAVEIPVTAQTTQTPVATSTADASASAEASASSDASSSTSASSTGSVVIASVGDMMFGRGVSSWIDGNSAEDVFAGVQSVLASADLTVGNLESPLASSTAGSGSGSLVGNPKAAQGMASAGIKAVGLANDHIMAYGTKAMNSTIDLLDQAGVQHAGAGPTRADAWKAATLQVGSGTVAFLSFTEISPGSYAATDSHGGVAAAKGKLQDVEAAIRDAKSSHDHVVVMFHWGTDKSSTIGENQVTVAHGAIDAGADLVAGAHPHVIQALEAYKGRLIAYSLGDFVFDHYTKATGESFILTTTLGPDGVSGATVTPVYLGMTSGRPSVVTGSEAATILKRLKRLSAAKGTTVSIDGDSATVEM